MYLFRIITNPVIVTNHGVRLNVQDPVLAPYKKLIYMNAWETDEVMLLKKYIDKNDQILEVGACIGFVSSCASMIIGSQRVTAIEANPDLIDAIKRMNKRNKIDFKVINAMIKKGGGREAFRKNSNIFSSSLSSRQGESSISYVQCIELHDLPVKQEPTFIIIDIEGGEYDFFLDFDMPDSVEKLLVEFHGIKKNSGLRTNLYTDVLKRLQDQSFKLIEVRGRVHLFKRIE